MDIVCFNKFSYKYAACKSDIVNIIPFLKLISVIAENSVCRDWVAEVKGFPVRLTAVTKEAPIYVKWWCFRSHQLRQYFLWRHVWNLPSCFIRSSQLSRVPFSCLRKHSRIDREQSLFGSKICERLRYMTLWMASLHHLNTVCATILLYP